MTHLCFWLVVLGCCLAVQANGGPPKPDNNQDTPSPAADHQTQDGENQKQAPAMATGIADPLQMGPVVARSQMNLILEGEVVDTIEIGDLLTVLVERDDSIVIQTFSGHKGAVAKGSIARLAEAAEIYNKLIRRDPQEGRLYTLRAGAYFAAGSHARALADYDKAIELGYQAGHAYTSRGLFYAARGEHEKALQDYAEAIRRDPEDDVPLLNRASVYISLGEYALAISDYDAAADLRADNAHLYSQRAVAYKLSGQLAKAIADYDSALKLSAEDVSSIMGRGFVKFQMGDNAGAVEDFSKAIELSPQSAVAFNNRGFNYQELGNEKLALADYLRARELAPKYLLALRNLAWLLTISTDNSIADPEQAIASATSVCELTEFSDFSDLILLAAAYASGQRFETAIGWQEKALAAAQDDQQQLATAILELYQDKKPIDPKLLEPEPSKTQEQK